MSTHARIAVMIRKEIDALAAHAGSVRGGEEKSSSLPRPSGLSVTTDSSHKLIRAAQPYFNPRSFRKTLAQLGQKRSFAPLSIVFALVPLCLRWNFLGERNLPLRAALVRSHRAGSFLGGIKWG